MTAINPSRASSRIHAHAVAGLARDAELTAQHRHLLPIQQPGDELEPFIHLVTLLQGTFALLAKGPVCNPCLRNELSPISQEGHGLKSLRICSFLARRNSLETSVR